MLVIALGIFDAAGGRRRARLLNRADAITQADARVDATGDGKYPHAGKDGIYWTEGDTEQARVEARQNLADENARHHDGDERGQPAKRIDDGHDTAHKLARGVMQGEWTCAHQNRRGGDAEEER